MAAMLSPLGNDLVITPSKQQLQDLFRQQVKVFENGLLTKIQDNNRLRVSSDIPMEKCIKMEVFRLVFAKSLATRFQTDEKVVGPQFSAVLTTLDRMIEVFGAKALVRRFRSGDFTIVLPLHAVVSDINISAQQKLCAGQLVIAIEMNGNRFKCLIPYGGSDPDAEGQTPEMDGYITTYIETSKERLWFPNYKGEGALVVEKGLHFVYSPCNVIQPNYILVLRGIEYQVLGVVKDVFDQTRDLVRLNRAPIFNSKHCAYEIRKPVQILATFIELPSEQLQYIRKLKLNYIEDQSYSYGNIELRFWNAAFNNLGILTHDIAIPASELQGMAEG